jgi:hypothetical protein
MRYFQASCAIYRTMSANPDPTPDAVTEQVLSLVATVKRLPREQVQVDSSFE